VRVFLKSFLIVVVLMTASACSNLGKKNDDDSSTAGGSDQAGALKEIPSFRVSDPVPPELADKELDTMPPELQPKVEQWINYFQGRGRPHMERYLARSNQYIQLMKRILRQNGLPEDIVYIALIESGFNSRATSRAAAVGFWQFIKGTGRRYSLEINSMVDERRDPVLATQAAAEYFKGLYSIFGSWYLSMASYNVGENRVKKEIQTQYTRDFWDLARKRRLPKETVNYVPKFIAAKWIAKNPEKYGFADIEYEKPVEFELIKVDRALNLKTMASKLGMEYEDFKFLNPKFRGEIAPLKNGILELRVPVGQKDQGLIAAQASFVDKVQFIADAGETETYRIRPGDSLYTIARKHHVTASWLKDVNDLKAGKRLKVGMRIQVPDRSAGARKSKIAKAEKAKAEKIAKTDVKPETKTETKTETVAKVDVKLDSTEAKTETKTEVKPESSVAETASNTEIETAKGLFYIVQQGDTLSSVADEYDSTIKELRKMNKLGKGSKLKVGMKLRVPKEESLPTTLEEPAAPVVAAAVTPASETQVEAKPEAKPEATSEVKTETLAAKADTEIKKESKPATTAAVPLTVNEVIHTVKSGENLTSIARQYGVTIKEIRDANNLKKKSKLSTGTTLTIPVKRSPSSSVFSKIKKSKKNSRYQARVKVHIVKRGENLARIAQKYQVSVNQLKNKNKISHSKLYVGVKLIIPRAEAHSLRN
jgi:membrane-bound lytic murein transglycosylase D